jgi:hypothetical protein
VPLNKSWHDYNESLIERGLILMDIGFLKSSNNEIKKMNQGKVGAPFNTHSHSYIHTFPSIPFLRLDLRKIAYRTVQGITTGLSDYISRIEKCVSHVSEEGC